MKKYQIQPDSTCFKILVNFTYEIHNSEISKHLFNKIQSKEWSIIPTLIDFNQLIQSFEQTTNPQQDIIEILNYMDQHSIIPDEITFLCLLNVFILSFHIFKYSFHKYFY